MLKEKTTRIHINQINRAPEEDIVN